MTNKKEYMIILFLHLPPLVLTQSRVRTTGYHSGRRADREFRYGISKKDYGLFCRNKWPEEKSGAGIFRFSGGGNETTTFRERKAEMQYGNFKISPKVFRHSSDTGAA